MLDFQDVLDLLQQLVVLPQLQRDVSQQALVILAQVHRRDATPKEFAHKSSCSEKGSKDKGES